MPESWRRCARDQTAHRSGFHGRCSPKQGERLLVPGAADSSWNNMGEVVMAITHRVVALLRTTMWRGVFLIVGLGVLPLGCGPGGPPSGQEQSGSPSAQSVPVGLPPPASAALSPQSAQPPQPRVDVSDDCLAFLMNKHQRASACESQKTSP